MSNNKALTYHKLAIQGKFEELKEKICSNEQQSLSLPPSPPSSPPSVDVNKLIKEYRGPGNNTFLHIAAKAGQVQMINELLSIEPDLLLCQNQKGDLPIHVALKAGQKDAVYGLISDEPGRDNNAPTTQLTLTDNHSASGGDTPLDINCTTYQLKLTDNEKDRNTALHLALEKHYENLSMRLFERCDDTIYQMNAKLICPVYQAIKVGFFGLANLMIDHEGSSAHSSWSSTNGMSVFKAAIEVNKTDILEKLINRYQEGIYLHDNKDRTLLSYAAEIGCVDGVKYLLDKHPDLAYLMDRDEDGAYPIHKACSAGNLDIVKAFEKIDEIMTLRNSKNQNILHYAAKSGQYDIVKYLLEKQPAWAKIRPWLLDTIIEEFINMKDDDGYTPLHLATNQTNPNPMVVRMLATYPKANLELQDKEGLTALDFFFKSAEQETTVKKRPTWMVLLYANVPQSPEKKEQQQNDTSNNPPGDFPYKDRLDGILLVSILIATVAFSATFTIPGGYVDSSSTNRDQGMAVLAKKTGFILFVLSNTIAMFFSIFSAVVLIWAHLNDTKLLLLSFKSSLISLGIALTMMSISVMSSLFVVLHTKCPGLSIALLVLGCVLMVAILLILVPLYSPISPSKCCVIRRFYSCILKLMLWVLP